MTDNGTNFITINLQGDWYILLGKNPAYDCYDCQVTTFHPVNTNGSTKTLMKYQVTTSNGEIKNYVSL